MGPHALGGPLGSLPVTSSPRSVRGSLLLLVAAAIWGSAFVAQRFGAQHMAFASFTAVRHALGSLVLLVMVAVFDRVGRRTRTERAALWRAALLPGLGVGVALSGGSLLQQAGLETTTAGNAGFITGMYMVFIPIVSWVVLRQRTSGWTWLGAVLGLTGLYLLSVRANFSVNTGDLLVLGCAVFWTGHILALERLGSLDPFRLCVVQFATCALVSLVFAVAFEPIPLSGVMQTLGPLAYAAFLSTGVGFTLQVLGQRDAPATHAALIMALEAVFAAIGGALVLGERMDLRSFLGAGFMLSAVLVAQLGAVLTSRPAQEALLHVPEP
jgi:drug/metabolite transporter (DMT)-like permease